MMRKQIKLLPQSSQSGFTILECLMAIIVVGILMTAIAPVIAISVATRVQARRVETGTQAAKAYIDGVRSGAIAPPNSYVLINEVQPPLIPGGSPTFNSQRNAFAQVAAPSPTLPACAATDINGTSVPVYKKGYCRNNGNGTAAVPVASTATTTSLYCIDLNGDGGCTSNNRDFIVQAVRSVLPATITDNTDAKKGYVLSVRVYRADAFRGSEALFKNSTNPNKRATQGTAGGDIGLRNRKAPLVEMTTEVADKNGTTYKNFCERFGGCR